MASNLSDVKGALADVKERAGEVEKFIDAEDVDGALDAAEDLAVAAGEVADLLANIPQE
jgi:hypothetical protein